MVLPPDESVLVAVSLGNKIRALRQRLKLTLDETSTIAGISKPFLSQVERGRATPSITSLVRIAKALGVTMQYFIDTPTEAFRYAAATRCSISSSRTRPAGSPG